MKFGLRKGWKSVVPLRLKGKSATRFCLFPKAKSTSYSPGRAPVYLNVYDLTPMNGYVHWAGLGIYHSGVEVHGVEYAFGAHDYPTSGVFEVEPRLCPGFKFRKSIFIGTTCLDPIQVREFMERQSAHYNGDTYHLIVKNCNHFCKDICYKLTGKPIPKWVNRLAKIGTLFLLYYFPCQGSCQFKVLSAMCLMPPDTCFFSGWQTNSIDGVHKD
ncbi:hypothetical protein CICLE_v10002284mg [Citrus x clementina]|uniref:PPPDE domain-containing protein n=1 Tax=Citrus clementina TaxID=85681 RepID=V4V7W5_CITCL|nr:hypothetical protein CICLE_v10002284mg [Citrus x clementina]ESR48185.1 hypothetical protein CICLE_v10002284mg [Citrus x clementina]